MNGPRLLNWRLPSFSAAAIVSIVFIILWALGSSHICLAHVVRYNLMSCHLKLFVGPWNHEKLYIRSQQWTNLESIHYQTFHKQNLQWRVQWSWKLLLICVFAIISLLIRVSLLPYIMYFTFIHKNVGVNSKNSKVQDIKQTNK